MATGRISYLARELLGVEAWEAGENDLARDTLENLTLAFDAPEAVRQRAQLALSVIGPAPATPADGASQRPRPPKEKPNEAVWVRSPLLAAAAALVGVLDRRAASAMRSIRSTAATRRSADRAAGRTRVDPRVRAAADAGSGAGARARSPCRPAVQ